MNKIYINTDGGSRGNPGHGGIGIVFFDEEGNELFSHREHIGVVTNNQAEYRAIIKALEIMTKSKWMKENNNPDSEIICRLDSKLVVEQISGRFKVKNNGIKLLITELSLLLDQIKCRVKFVHIRREENKRADKLVNIALDEKDEK